jgi:hypothetical protein
LRKTLQLGCRNVHSEKKKMFIALIPALVGHSSVLDQPADSRIEAVREHENVAQVLHHEQRKLVVERSPARMLTPRVNIKKTTLSYKKLWKDTVLTVSKNTLNYFE